MKTCVTIDSVSWMNISLIKLAVIIIFGPVSSRQRLLIKLERARSIGEYLANDRLYRVA